MSGVISGSGEDIQTLSVGGSKNRKANVLLIGLMGCGKSTIAEVLARKIGYGFIDIDSWIKRKEGKSIAQIFEEKGQDGFRLIEKSTIGSLGEIRNHVISVGGGAVLDDDNWNLFARIATSVWIKTPTVEIARRIVMSPDEIRKRPLIADLVNIEDRDDRLKQLQDRLNAIETQRGALYGKANLVVDHAHGTPETCAHFIRILLEKSGSI